MLFARIARVAAAALLLGACAPPEEQAERARTAVREALARGDREAALAGLRDLRESQPDTPEAVLGYATLLVRAAEASQAQWRLESAVQRFPEHHELRLLLANTALLVNDASRARAAAQRIPVDAEQHPRALLILAWAELQLGNLEAALAHFEDAERRYPDLSEARVARIATLLNERRLDEARQALEEAKRSPESAEASQALRRMEIALYRVEAGQGESEAAIAGLRALVETDPSDVPAWNALVQVLWLAGRPAEARDTVRAALEADSEQLALYTLLASLHAAFGEADEAERLLREYAERSESPAAYLPLAVLYARRQDADRALEVYDDALEAFPGEPMLRKLRAETLVDFGRIEEARAELRRLQEALPEDPAVEYLRARLELAEDDAVGAAARLLKLIPRLDEAATQFWLGRALEASGDALGAERRYGLAMVRQPSEPTFYLAAIASAERRGDWRVVGGYAQRLVRNAPGLFEGWVALVAALTNLGEAQRAEQIARKLVEAIPDRADARLLLAGALRAGGRYAEALEQLAEAGERAEPTPQLAAERALTLGMSGRVQEAVATTRRALETNPDLAALLFQAGQAEEGARAADRALALDPSDPSPLRMRAEFRAATGRVEEARGDCERYLQHRPDDPVVHFILGVVHAKAGRPEQAIAAYQRAAELDSEAYAPRNNLADLLAARGDLDAALAAAQEAYRIAEDNPSVVDTLGWLYLSKGLVERSISLLEDAHTAAPEQAAVQLHLALAYREAGRSADARRLLLDLRSRGADRGDLQAQVEEALHSLP
jgi:tetratricopeptide (TPR) repeat protein